MPTVQPNHNPASRIAIGQAVIESAEDADTSKIKGKLGAFQKMQKEYVTADGVVKVVVGKLHLAHITLGQSHDDQDQALDDLAVALVTAGYARINPFTTFSKTSPSLIKDMDFKTGAAAIHALVAKLKKTKGLGAGAIAAATKADNAASVVEKDFAALTPLVAAQTSAINHRDTKGMAWERSFSALKRAARTAEDDGAVGLFAALFESKKPVEHTDESAVKKAGKKIASESVKLTKSTANVTNKNAKAAAKKEAKAAKGKPKKS